MATHQRVVLALSHRVPRLVVVDVAVVAVVLLMTKAPAVVGHEDERVRQVADGVVQGAAVREGAVAAVVADAEERPHQGALQQPVGGPDEPV